jgi:hypothetical protein
VFSKFRAFVIKILFGFLLQVLSIDNECLASVY